MCTVFSEYLRFHLHLSLNPNDQMAILWQNNCQITIWPFDWLFQIWQIWNVQSLMCTVFSEYLRFHLHLSLNPNDQMAILWQNNCQITIWPFDSLFQIWQMVITIRNEVAKVMFLQASVCPEGGVPVPLEEQVHPPDQVHPKTRYIPLGPGTPPRTRYTPLRDRYIPPWDQVHPPVPGTSP